MKNDIDKIKTGATIVALISRSLHKISKGQTFKIIGVGSDYVEINKQDKTVSFTCPITFHMKNMNVTWALKKKINVG